MEMDAREWAGVVWAEVEKVGTEDQNLSNADWTD
jgi:hypothetical protein